MLDNTEFILVSSTYCFQYVYSFLKFPFNSINYPPAASLHNPTISDAAQKQTPQTCKVLVKEAMDKRLGYYVAWYAR